MSYIDRANTPTEALGLDILNAYLAHAWGNEYQIDHWDLLTIDQRAIAAKMADAVKNFESGGTYNDLVSDILKNQCGSISARALASKIWPRIVS